MFSYKQRHVRAAVLSSLVLFFVFIAMSASLFSQTAATGGLTGTVKDSSGAVVPNATVTATNIGTSQSRTTVTTAE
jgi:hypothetical protein